jgi:hypothetical protein
MCRLALVQIVSGIYNSIVIPDLEAKMFLIFIDHAKKVHSRFGGFENPPS